MRTRKRLFLKYSDAGAREFPLNGASRTEHHETSTNDDYAVRGPRPIVGLDCRIGESGFR